MLDPVFSPIPVTPATVASPGLAPEEAAAWANLPEPLARYTSHGLSRDWQGEKREEIRAEVAQGMLRAWSEAPAKWKAAITALAAGPTDFAAWVRSTYKNPPVPHRSEWALPRERLEQDQRSNLSGPLMIGSRVNCSTSLLNIVIETRYLPHYAARLETGLLTPDANVLNRLGKRHGQPRPWVDREHRLRIEWVKSLSQGHMDEPVTIKKTIVKQAKKRSAS